MTTDRTAAPRPPRHDRPTPHAQAQSPAADAFAEILGAQAPAPQRREPQQGRRREPEAKPAFEASMEAPPAAVNGRPDPSGALSGPGTPAAAAQPGQPGQSGQPAQPGQSGQPAQPAGAHVGAGVAAVTGEAAPAAAVTAPAAGQGIIGPLAPGGAETTAAGADPNAQQIKLPKVPAMPVPAPPPGKAATPAGWLGPQTDSLKPTPPVAPPPAAAPVAAPPNGEAATPSGWRGPESQAPAPQATPAQTATSTSAPPATPTPTPTTSTTPLAHAPQAVSALLQMAHDRGISRARINLRPVELGGIEVRLHATAAGVTAHLVADSPEAAKLLSQAGDELRRSLEQRDVNLLSLEVSTSADHHRDAPKGHHGPEADDFRSSVTPRGEREPEPDTPGATTTTSTLELPGGLLVDVLA
jgi:hypothetical protein